MSRYYIVSTVFLVLFLGSLSLDGSFDISWYWYAGLVIIYLVINVYGAFVVSAQYFVPIKYRGEGKSQSIAITFDDGPIPGNTEKILDILQQHNVLGTFFCIGNRVQKNIALTRRIYTEGHLICNHSYWHGAMFDLQSAGGMTRELMDTDRAINESIGRIPKFFRPPYGVTNPMLAKAVSRRNYTVIGWSVRSFDTVIKNKVKLFNRVTRSLKAGDIVLFHDYSDTTLSILSDFLAHVSKRGLKIVRVDELLKEKAYA